MRTLVVDHLPWLISAVTIWMTWRAGDKHPSAWAWAIGGQVLWAVWIVAAGAWGFVPAHLVLWVVYLRNHWRWAREGAL